MLNVEKTKPGHRQSIVNKHKLIDTNKGHTLLGKTWENNASLTTIRRRHGKSYTALDRSRQHAVSAPKMVLEQFQSETYSDATRDDDELLLVEILKLVDNLEHKISEISHPEVKNRLIDTVISKLTTNSPPQRTATVTRNTGLGNVKGESDTHRRQRKTGGRRVSFVIDVTDPEEYIQRIVKLIETGEDRLISESGAVSYGVDRADHYEMLTVLSDMLAEIPKIEATAEIINQFLPNNLYTRLARYYQQQVLAHLIPKVRDGYEAKNEVVSKVLQMIWFSKLLRRGDYRLLDVKYVEQSSSISELTTDAELSIVYILAGNDYYQANSAVVCHAGDKLTPAPGNYIIAALEGGMLSSSA